MRSKQQNTQETGKDRDYDVRRAAHISTQWHAVTARLSLPVQIQHHDSCSSVGKRNNFFLYVFSKKGSAISAFYSATCALVVWLGSHGGTRPAQDFADTWAPRLNLTSPDFWHAPLLRALSASHALLLQDYGCVEWTFESDRVQRLWRSRLHSLLCSQV